MERHGLAVAGGQDEPGAFPLGRTNSAEDIGGCGLLIARRRGACPTLGPAAGDFVLLPDAGFVLPPDFYRLVASLFCGRLFQEGGEVFLKAVAASASCA
jgi:hypothetical protein